MVDSIKCNNTINLDPTSDPNNKDVFSDNATFCMSNTTKSAKNAIAIAANQEMKSFPANHAITGTRAILVFVMNRIPMQNVN
jgi:hypothetical protein